MAHATAPDKIPDASPALAGAAIRYPEKTFFLGQVFNDTTNSYKLVWFLAILALIKWRVEDKFPISDILTEMAVAAWHPVCLYRLSLGRQDKLQHLILELQKQSGLPPHATPQAVREFVDGSGAIDRLKYFRRYVPTRFLAPWVADHLRGERDDALRTRKTIEFARDSQTTLSACPYFFEADTIRLNDSWRVFLRENLGVVESFAEHHFAMYLQARNPNVPGVLNKLHAPTLRQLTAARNFWRLVRSGFARAEKLADFRDIYSERQLADSFSVDHFLPWTFVVHDLLWNLTPVEDATNSRKGDVFPDLDVYLPRLAKLHFNAIQSAKHQPRLLEDYIECFKQDPAGLLALGESGFEAKYWERALTRRTATRSNSRRSSLDVSGGAILSRECASVSCPATSVETMSNFPARLKASRSAAIRSGGSSMTFKTYPRLTTVAFCFSAFGRNAGSQPDA